MVFDGRGYSYPSLETIITVENNSNSVIKTGMNEKSFTLDELVALVGLPKRTVRYYIQIELMDRPEGAVRVNNCLWIGKVSLRFNRRFDCRAIISGFAAIFLLGGRFRFGRFGLTKSERSV